MYVICKPPTAPNNILTPTLNYHDTKAKVSFSRACLKQDKVTFNHGKIVNIYIVYKIIRIANINSRDNNLTVQNALFAAVSLTRNAEVGKYKYSAYGIAVDRTSSFSFPGGGYGHGYVIVFGVDMNSFIHVDNKGKDILILEKGPT